MSAVRFDGAHFLVQNPLLLEKPSDQAKKSKHTLELCLKFDQKLLKLANESQKMSLGAPPEYFYVGF